MNEWQRRFDVVLRSIGWTGVLAVLALIVLAIAASVAPEKDYWSEFAKIAGVGLTLLFSIATLISSFSTERLKVIAARELEGVKLAAMQEIEITRIRAQASLEELKFRYQAELESEKRKIDFEVKTYEVLMNAISGYYRAIEDTVEKGFADERFEKWDGEMKKADVFSHWLPAPLVTPWYGYWQAGSDVMQSCKGVETATGRAAIWEPERKRVAELLRELREGFKVRRW
jgi:hypothetical protein